METQERYDEIAKLLENKEFSEKLETVATVEEAVTLFKQNGVNVTADELTKIIRYSDNENLSAEELDAVSGGSILKKIGACIACGIAKLSGGSGAFGGGGGGSR